MSNTDLASLEKKLDHLLAAYAKVTTDNQQLREDKKALLEKTKQARSRIEKMIQRLKIMETKVAPTKVEP